MFNRIFTAKTKEQSTGGDLIDSPWSLELDLKCVLVGIFCIKIEQCIVIIATSPRVSVMPNFWGPVSSGQVASEPLQELGLAIDN